MKQHVNAAFKFLAGAAATLALTAPLVAAGEYFQFKNLDGREHRLLIFETYKMNNRNKWGLKANDDKIVQDKNPYPVVVPAGRTVGCNPDFNGNHFGIHHADHVKSIQLDNGEPIPVANIRFFDPASQKEKLGYLRTRNQYPDAANVGPEVGAQLPRTFFIKDGVLMTRPR